MEERIIEILSDVNKPAKSAIEINDALGFTDIQDYKKLESVLEKMTRDGVLYYSEKKRRYLLLMNSHLLKGKLIMNPKGFGFVDIGEGKKDVYINKFNLNNARNNDVVLIELVGDKTEGRVVKIINRDENLFVGCVYFRNGKCFVKPDKKGGVDIEILPEFQKGLVDGHKVLVQPVDGSKYVGKICHIIGHKNDVGIDILSFVYEHGFNPKFPMEVLEELESIEDSVSPSDMVGRVDLRHLNIFTIDGDDTKDIDDAISVDVIGDKYILGVHIADVSHYVSKGSALDKEAYDRGTSVYLVDRVIPMLPHQLSNGICSLNPGVDRLAMSCIMTIDKKGKIVDYKVCKSVIRSRIQMTYKKVNDILDKGIVAEGYEEFVNDLMLMNELSLILRKKMVSRGYIEFSSAEAKVLVDENCHPVEIVLRQEGTGENMIENFMVAANETMGSFVYYQNLPGIYRVHDKPDPEKLRGFFEFLNARGYVVNGKRQNITSRDLQNVLKQLEDKPDAKILNDMAIRSQAKAVYSSDNIGHFGLGSKCYSHFTSPIRRYPDLILHRLIKDYTENYSYDVIEDWNEKLPVMAEHCSVREQDAQKCERDVLDMKKAEYMEEHIGEVFDGVISGVQEFGIFVELANTVEGLVKINDLPGSGYTYLEAALSLVSRDRKYKFSFGDCVTVKCVRASKDTGMIDFSVVDCKELSVDSEIRDNNYDVKKKQRRRKK